MINIDKDYLITVDLKNTKVKSDKTIFFYNTDLNICNIFIKLICTDEDKTIPDDLIVEFAVLKPETDEFKPLDATLISKEDLLYQVDLTTDYFDIVGKYSCEIRVSGTIDNEKKCFTSESFDYVVRPNITAKLNNQIKNDKNLPILEKLIKEVNDIGLGIEMNQVQLKKDDNLVGDNKSIVGAINQLREDVNSGIGGGTVELKDYQKKNDEFLNTDEKTITGGINEVNNKIKKVQESQIELDKDDVSFNGIDDISHDTLTTTNKTLIGAINEVNTQCKEIANNQPTDLSLDSATNLLQLVNSKGSKLGNGITLPISSGGGTSQYLHIKYSSTGAPQLAGQISDTPNAYIGLCVDTNADSPTNPKNYTWYNWKGDNGDTGATPNLQIGTVTTLESGSNATASITGTTENPVLNLGIPKGDKGDTGASGTGTGGDTETWEKVIETTFGEECYAFTVTQDKDGNPLQLKEGFIFLTVSQPKDTGSSLSYGMGFSNWESSFNGKTNIYNIGLMKNYEFYRTAFYFKVINNYVFTQCLGNVRIGTTAPKYNVFTQPNVFNANTVSNFRVLTNSLEYVDKITVGLDMSTTGLFSADSIMEVWAKC